MTSLDDLNMKSKLVIIESLAEKYEREPKRKEVKQILLHVRKNLELDKYIENDNKNNIRLK